MEISAVGIRHDEQHMKEKQLSFEQKDTDWKLQSKEIHRGGYPRGMAREHPERAQWWIDLEQIGHHPCRLLILLT